MGASVPRLGREPRPHDAVAAGRPRDVEFIPMPSALRGQYQSFTQARMDRLRQAGYPGQFTPLEDGVRRYVQRYLASGAPYA